jgi:hypothetical protein
VIAFVQSAQAVNGGFLLTSLSKAYTSNNVAGNLLVLVFRNFTGGGFATPAVSDTQGNTWIPVYGAFSNAGSANIAFFYVENCAGGANTVTVTNNSGFPGFVILEYSGVAASSSLEAQTHATGSGTAANSGNITTSNAADLLVGFSENETNGGFSVSPGAGWTQRELEDGVSACDQIISSAGTYAFSSTIGGTASWSASIAAFKGAAPAGASAQPVVCIMQ